MRYIAPQVNSTTKATSSIHGQLQSKIVPNAEGGQPTSNSAYEADE